MNRGHPFEFKLGKGQVIPGWDVGRAGMKVGGRRQLTIPSAMAYGARGAGGVIAPHEPLVFVVDLLAVGDPAAGELRPRGPSRGRGALRSLHDPDCPTGRGTRRRRHTAVASAPA